MLKKKKNFRLVLRAGKKLSVALASEIGTYKVIYIQEISLPIKVIKVNYNHHLGVPVSLFFV